MIVGRDQLSAVRQGRPAASAAVAPRRAAAIIVVAALSVAALALTACSGSSGPSGPGASSPGRTSPGSPAATGGQADPATLHAISVAYARVFGTKSTLAQSLASLQNGQAFRRTIVAESKQPGAQKSGAKVTAATLTSGNVADVIFTISSSIGALPNAKGKAVRVNGTWKVAAKTFCGLLSLQGHPPKPCSDPKITALPG